MSDFSIVFLPSWPHIHFAFSSIPRPVIHFFPVFCHHMLHLTFVLMYHACTEIWTLDLEIKSFLLYQTKLYRRFPGFTLQCAWWDLNPTTYRLKAGYSTSWVTDANQYSVFGISPSVFVLFFSLSLILLFILFFYIFLFFVCFRHLCRGHQLMRRDLNPQTLRLITPRLRRSRYQITAALRLPITADRATYLHNALNFYFMCSF